MVGVPSADGEAVYAFVVVAADAQATDILEAELKGLVRREVGPAASPQVVHFAAVLPRTKAGHLARRILRKVAAGETQNLGDTGALADPAVLDDLLKKPATA